MWPPCSSSRVLLSSVTPLPAQTRIPQRTPSWPQRPSRVQHEVVHRLHTVPRQGSVPPSFRRDPRSLSKAPHTRLHETTLRRVSRVVPVILTSPAHGRSTAPHENSRVLHKPRLHSRRVPQRITNLHWTRRARHHTALLHRTLLHWTRTCVQSTAGLPRQQEHTPHRGLCQPRAAHQQTRSKLHIVVGHNLQAQCRPTPPGLKDPPSSAPFILSFPHSQQSQRRAPRPPQS